MIVCLVVCPCVCLCVCLSVFVSACVCVYMCLQDCVCGEGGTLYICVCVMSVHMCGGGGLCIYTYARPSVFLGLVYAQVAIQSNI